VALLKNPALLAVVCGVQLRQSVEVLQGELSASCALFAAHPPVLVFCAALQVHEWAEIRLQRLHDDQQAVHVCIAWFFPQPSEAHLSYICVLCCSAAARGG
jgi:hypothetical protein